MRLANDKTTLSGVWSLESEVRIWRTMADSFGSFVRRRRQALKKSGRQLSRESGVSSGYLSQIEADRFIPKPAILRKLALPLQISYDRLLIEADILPETLAEESAGYAVSGLSGAIAIAGPRLTLPILGRLPAKNARDAFRRHLGDCPYIEEADFAVEMGDDSLVEANILRGDLIYIKKKTKPDKGELTLVRVGNEVFLRFWTPAGKKAKLAAANKKISDIVTADIEIVGVKVAVLRR